MKKIFTTIFATLFGATALMAQEESTFVFVHNGEVVPSGSTVTISEYELAESIEGVMNVFEMQSGLAVKNASDGDEKLIIHVVGIENYDPHIQVCPGGNCRPWINGEITIELKSKIPAGSMEDAGIHVSYMDMECNPNFSYNGSIKVEAINYYDEEDISSITLVFDTEASSIKETKADKNTSCEVYNLCGKKIANTMAGLSKGVYIVKQNGTSRKVVIK